MTVVKSISGRPLRIGGAEHTGWLPAGATKPLPTPVREVLLNIEIQCDGPGYILCFSSSDGTVVGDTWHETLGDAERDAHICFGIESSEWVSPQ